MNRLYRHREEMFFTVIVFCNSNLDLLPTGSLEHDCYEELSSVTKELTKHSVNQGDGIQQSRKTTERILELRKSLLGSLRNIIQVARWNARTAPEFDEPFKLPASQGDAALLYTARQLVELTSASADVFLRYAITPDFIAGVKKSIEQLEQEILGRAAMRKSHRKATTGIAATIKRGMDAVAKLNVILTNKLRADRSKMAVWKSACHVQRLPRKRSKPAEAGTVGE